MIAGIPCGSSVRLRPSGVVGTLVWHRGVDAPALAGVQLAAGAVVPVHFRDLEPISSPAAPVYPPRALPVVTPRPNTRRHATGRRRPVGLQAVVAAGPCRARRAC